jgi:hypothetical protein
MEGGSPIVMGGGGELGGGEDIDGGADNGSPASAWGQRGTGCSCGPSHGHCGARGSRTMMVDGELPWQRIAAVKSTLAGRVAIGLSSKAMGKVEEKERVLSTDLENDGRRQRWLAPVEQGGRQCRAERERAGEGGSEMQWGFSPLVYAWDKDEGVQAGRCSRSSGDEQWWMA